MKAIKNIGKSAMPVLTTGAGVIASNYVQRLVPVQNDKLKSGITILGGLLLAGSKNKTVSALGTGIAAGGVANLAKGFGIGGDDTLLGTPEVLIAEVETEEISGNDDPESAY